MLARILLPFLLAFGACRPEPVTPDSDPIPTFTGISPTDFNGAPLGDPDTSDWRLDDVWIPAETALFPSAPAATCTASAGFSVYPAYPNPCGDVVALTFLSQPNALWDLVLVDGDLKPLRNILAFSATQGANNLQFDLSAFPSDTLRLYYRVRFNDCLLRGHGDLLKN